MSLHEFVKPGFLLGLLVIAWMALRTLRRHSEDPASRFDWTELLLGDDGKPSKAAMIMFGAFAVSSWVLVYLALTQPEMSVGVFGTYCTAWVAPTVTALVVNAWKAAPKGAPPSTTVVNASTVTGGINTPGVQPSEQESNP